MTDIDMDKFSFALPKFSNDIPQGDNLITENAPFGYYLVHFCQDGKPKPDQRIYGCKLDGTGVLICACIEGQNSNGRYTRFLFLSEFCRKSVLIYHEIWRRMSKKSPTCQRLLQVCCYIVLHTATIDCVDENSSLKSYGSTSTTATFLTSFIPSSMLKEEYKDLIISQPQSCDFDFESADASELIFPLKKEIISAHRSALSMGYNYVYRKFQDVTSHDILRHLMECEERCVPFRL